MLALSFGPPAANQIEITTIGGGLNGESIVIHLGNDEWVIVDSCMDGDIPAALSYLDALGVSFSKVRFVVCSHWHYDHIAGIGRVLDACKNARFVIPQIGNKKDYLTLLLDAVNSKDRQNLIEREFRQCHDIVERRRGIFGQLREVGCRSIVHEVFLDKDRRNAVRLESLSPSDQLRQDFDRNLLKSNSEDDMRPYDLNMCCIALSLHLNNMHAIIGADLERNDPLKDKRVYCKMNCDDYLQCGWCNVISEWAQCPPVPFSFIKLPHHSSKNAYCPVLWDSYRAKDRHVKAASTLYRAGHRLPTGEMLKVYHSLTDEFYLTGSFEIASPGEKVKERPTLLMEELAGIKCHLEYPKIGIICARITPDDREWTIRLGGAARKVDADMIDSFE